MASTRRVAVIQWHIKDVAAEENHATACDYIRKSAAEGAELAVLPEYASPRIVICANAAGYHLSGMVPNDPRWAIQAGESAKYLSSYQALAKELKICIVPGTIIEKHEGPEQDTVFYNTAYFISNDGSILSSYVKKNIWHPERPHLTSSGLDPHVAFDTPIGRVGMLICWDLAFPEAFRELIADGADIVIIPTYWTPHDASPDCIKYNKNTEALFLETTLTSRCFENTCGIIFCNASGPSDDFLGLSQITLPLVGPIAKMGNEDGICVADMDLKVLEVAEQNYKVRQDMKKDDWHYVYRHTSSLCHCGPAEGPFSVPKTVTRSAFSHQWQVYFEQDRPGRWSMIKMASGDHSISEREITPHRLPTRVRTACERCRLHKSRCDNARPCLLCVRAGADCRQLPSTRTPTSTSKARKASSRRNRGLARSKNVSAQRSLHHVHASHQDDSVDLQNTESPSQRSSNRLRPADSPARISQPDVTASMGILSPPSNCDEAQSALGIAQRIFELSSQHLDETTTSAIPGYRAGTHVDHGASRLADNQLGQRRSISSIIGAPFPSMDLVYSLLEDYFDAVHWFSLAIYEPKFRKTLDSIADGSANPSDKPFLLLLSAILAMATWYRSQRSSSDSPESGDEWRAWSASSLKLVESNLVEIMDRPSVTAIQTCVLLGSHHVYHGRPNLSFSLLGSTIKMAQSLGLHRQSSRGTSEEVEERKRIWWTIYTWDRFASITYGRPLGISDKDCNVEMPADVSENPYFVTSHTEPNDFITYSPYQRELNKLYLIASPALEIVFGSRTTGSDQLTGDSYYELAKEATQNLQQWSSQLPRHLALDPERDFPGHADLKSRAHALQSLALQLTYDNVLIVLHRPLLNRQVDYLSNKSQVSPTDWENRPMDNSGAGGAINSSSFNFDEMNPKVQDDSSRLWMSAAVRTSRVTELPVLAQLATDSHLVAFLAINLFNAAIVLAVMALSEPLSDMAQDIKRTITRILRLQDLLGKRSALSRQSTLVLRNVVILLLHRESAAIFAPISSTNQQSVTQTQNDASYNEPISVEDTLRLPLDTTLDARHQPMGDQTWLPPSRADRLNESLTSVQYVFGSGNENASSFPPTENPAHRIPLDEGLQSRGNVHPFSIYDWNMPGLPENIAQEGAYDTIDGGLCWLWDTTWNGFERQ